MKTTMKMTKRFFALLTALVLCLAPMALMVGAAEVSVYVLRGNCLTCGTKNEIVGYNQLIPHPTVYYKEDGSYYCRVCGYNMD